MIIYFLLLAAAALFTSFMSFDHFKRRTPSAGSRITACVIFIAHWICLSITSLFNYPVWKLLTMLLLNGLLGRFYFKRKGGRLLHDLLFFFLLGFLEFLCVPFMSFLLFAMSDFVGDNLWFAGLVPLAVQVLILGLYRALSDWMLRRTTKTVTKVQVFTYVVMPVFSLINVFIMMWVTQFYIIPLLLPVVCANVIFILVINLYVTWLFDTLDENHRLSRSLALYEQQRELQYGYYSRLEEKYENARRVIHDVKRHVNAMEQLYESAEPERGRAYGEDLRRLLSSFGQDVYTENRMLNIILNEMAERCAGLGIALECRMNGTNPDFIREIDMTVIFVNLLDNAIEAAVHAAGEKRILLTADRVHDFYVISLRNPYKKPPVTENDRLLSGKESHEAMGLSNVEQAIARYDGHMHVEYGGNEFQVTLMLPVQDVPLAAVTKQESAKWETLKQRQSQD